MNKYNFSIEFSTDKDALKMIDKIRPYIVSTFEYLGVEHSVVKLELLEPAEETEVQECFGED